MLTLFLPCLRLSSRALLPPSSLSPSVATREPQVKPLGVIWGKYPDYYDPHNSIMFDDIRRNFLMNPQNGLRIRPFREAHKNRETDKELLKLSKYLRVIAQLDSLSILNHKHWERFLRDNC